MLPQGSSPSDTDFFTQLTAQINGTNVCADLQALVSRAYSSMQAESNAVEAQLAALEPVKALLAVPSDLGSVISWITNFINYQIKPAVIPIGTYTTQQQSLISELAGLATAIENAAARIGNCSIAVPTVAGGAT